ncbi:uncharacterized protein LOC142616129 [Castanea sativa]|uniref:uncharacterized protein LOC142616129 n=1 Tax=Castanea sativa TaxID=21020 RepID=UPI003F64951D
MRWFNGLKAGSIDSFMELTRAFGSCFITYSRVHRPLDSLLSMAMREGETLRINSDRYWEMFNEIDGDFDDVAIWTFKVGLHTEHVGSWIELMSINGLRKINNRLVKEGRLKQFLYHPSGQGGNSGSVSQGNISLRSPLGKINVIFAALCRTSSRPTKVMSMSRTLAEESNSEPKRIKGNTPPILGFLEEDKIRIVQPHDDALVVTLRIGGYDVRRVMVNQGSGVDIMYPDLFKRLNLKLEDLTTYDLPLISFKGKAVIPK